MMYYGNGWNWVIALIMMALMMLFMAGIIAVIVYAIRGFARGSYSPTLNNPVEDRALATLRERYARGDIDHAEYEERRKRLMSEGPR